jgi:hypothetical protein
VPHDVWNDDTLSRAHELVENLCRRSKARPRMPSIELGIERTGVPDVPAELEDVCTPLLLIDNPAIEIEMEINVLVTRLPE